MDRLFQGMEPAVGPTTLKPTTSFQSPPKLCVGPHSHLSGESLAWAERLHPHVWARIIGAKKRKRPTPDLEGERTKTDDDDEGSSTGGIHSRQEETGLDPGPRPQQFWSRLADLPTEIQIPILLDMLDMRRLMENIPQQPVELNPERYESWRAYAQDQREKDLVHYLAWTDVYRMRIRANARYLYELFHLIREKTPMRDVVLAQYFRNLMYRRWYRFGSRVGPIAESHKTPPDVMIDTMALPPTELLPSEPQQKRVRQERISEDQRRLSPDWYRILIYNALVEHYFLRMGIAQTSLLFVDDEHRFMLVHSKGPMRYPYTRDTRMQPRIAMRFMDQFMEEPDRDDPTEIHYEWNPRYTILRSVIRHGWWEPGVLRKDQQDWTLRIPKNIRLELAFPGSLFSWRQSIVKKASDPKEPGETDDLDLRRYYELIYRAIKYCSVVRLPMFDYIESPLYSELPFANHMTRDHESRRISYELNDKLAFFDDYELSAPRHRFAARRSPPNPPISTGLLTANHLLFGRGSDAIISLNDMYFASKPFAEDWISRLLDGIRIDHRDKTIIIRNVYHRKGDLSLVDPDLYNRTGEMRPADVEATLVLLLERNAPDDAAQRIREDHIRFIEAWEGDEPHDPPQGWVRIRHVKMLSWLRPEDDDDEADMGIIDEDAEDDDDDDDDEEVETWDTATFSSARG